MQGHAPPPCPLVGPLGRAVRGAPTKQVGRAANECGAPARASSSVTGGAANERGAPARPAP
eukprot:13569969-Alexandrium_andersonii.AAC.1